MSEPDGRRGEAVQEPNQSWLVRAVPALVLGVGLIAMAAGMVIAAQSEVSERASESAFHDLASALKEVATAIEKGPRRRPEPEEDGPPEDAGATE